MGYPVAYRTSAARGARQLSRASSPVRTPTARPRANENARRPVNIPNRLPPGGLKQPLDYARFARNVIPLMRLHPALRTAMNVYDLWSFWREQNPAAVVTTTPASGYTLCCTSGTPGIDLGYWGVGGTNNCGMINLCGAQQGPFGQTPWTTNWTYRVGRNPPSIINRIFEHWHYNPAVGPQVSPLPVPLPMPRPIEIPFAPVRWIDPLQFTPIQPLAPQEIPMMPPPGAAPAERAYQLPRQRPVADNAPRAWPLSRPVGRRRPEKGTKEKKFRATRTASFVARALKSSAFVDGKLKDLRDLVTALHDSLPKELQLKGAAKKRLPDLLAHTWKHLDKMDAKEAFLGVLEEIAEDIIGGVGDRLRGAAATKNGWFKTKIFTSPRF